ncbi:phospholipid transfer protein-like [Archocentrus centrarchus]|uniref:phospholipid transfer protein-like n=1 Tax=Archocentrus centrarchus TaxID=63155 RepID=UPI0011EA2CBA|nr:phospholipid transfer protein-like [Archocentrus centrarchus]
MALYCVACQLDGRVREFKLTIAAENVNANMEVSLTRSAQGRLAIDMPVCEALAGKFLPITNGNEWPRIGTERFPQIFSFLFCRAVSWFVLPAVKGMLDTTPMTTEVSPDFGIAIDYTLTRDVQMRATGLDLSFKGLVYRPADNINPPNPGVELAFNENTRMAYVGVSDFLFNSAATAFYSAGALVKQEPWHLREAVDAEIKLTEAPSFSISESEGVTINLRAKLQDSASGTRAPGKLLAVSMRCAVSMKVSIDGTHLFLPYDKVSCKIQTRNVVRDVLVKIVKNKVNKKISDFLEGYFKDGVKIPLPEGMIFTQQMITYHDGFVVLGGDLSFTAAGRQGMVNMARGPGK